jgi:hypothetical protein
MGWELLDPKPAGFSAGSIKRINVCRAMAADAGWD